MTARRRFRGSPPGIAPLIVCLLAVLALTSVVSVDAASALVPAPAERVQAHRAQATPYAQLAEAGIAQGASWRSGHWYCEYLGCTGAYPLLTIWGDVRMFESVDALDLAEPSRGHRALVDRFGRG